MIIGIDLGTTNSAVAHLDENGVPSIIPNREGERVTPSVILFEDGVPIVGSTAKSMSISDASSTVQFVKRQMGNPSYKFLTEEGTQFTPEELSALILKRLKVDAEEMLDTKITQAVITVPAYFDDAQRKSTQDAGKIAGLEVLRVINEPTAAALAYGLANPEQEQNVLVYDLGGGTFDVTIIKIEKDSIVVKATDGDRNLGGFDFDNKIFEFVEQQFESQTGIDLYDDLNAVQDLREKAEACKKTLTTRKKATIVLNSQGHNVKVEITKEDFEQMISPLVNRTTLVMRSVLAESQLEWSDIDKVLLVGGSTRIPLISEAIEKLTGIEPSKDVNPDEVVAIGAAYQAEILRAENTKTELPPQIAKTKIIDVNSHSLGMITYNGNMAENSIVLVRNTPIPAMSSRTFYTASDNQTHLNLQVTEGEDTDAEYVKIIGTSLLEFKKPLMKGYPIQFNFSYDANGVVFITANDGENNEYLGELAIERKSNLSQLVIEASAEKIAGIDVE